MYIITARRITSGDVLKYLNGLRIRGGYETARQSSSRSFSDRAKTWRLQWFETPPGSDGPGLHVRYSSARWRTDPAHRRPALRHTCTLPLGEHPLKDVIGPACWHSPFVARPLSEIEPITSKRTDLQISLRSAQLGGLACGRGRTPHSQILFHMHRGALHTPPEQAGR